MKTNEFSRRSLLQAIAATIAALPLRWAELAHVAHGSQTAAQLAGEAPVSEQTSSMHLLGTCRMGKDPATSVVDRYHRSHDVPNLFVCDGSSLVTSGRGQPTMTIQALAFRAGENIARFAKRGEIYCAIA
jgi:choline dehydrogenase-like flavoprotein